MRNYCIIILLIFWGIHPVFGQNESSQLSVRQLVSTEIVNVPTAGTLGQWETAVGLRVYPNGGVLADAGIGILNRLFVRFYYGGENIIGEGSVNWNHRAGFDARFRIVDETVLFPGVAIGINTQGYGGFHADIDRYAIKSRGIYGVISRNYAAPFGDVGVHFGSNVSLERKDNDKDLNIFGGATVGIRNFGEWLLEYDAGLNDNEDLSLGLNKGYFNTGIQFFISADFILSFHFTNLLENTKNHKSIGREIRIEYRKQFSIKGVSISQSKKDPPLVEK
jgi:hypothetical protein